MVTKIENIALNNQNIIKKEVETFLMNNKIASGIFVDVKFVSISQIKALNKKYRKIDKPTDVLSFPIWKSLKNIPKKGKINLGDIIICPQIVEGNSLKFKTEFKEELSRIIQHSLNHLVGRHH